MSLFNQISSFRHQLPRVSLEEELAERQVPAHQDHHGQARPPLLNGLTAVWVVRSWMLCGMIVRERHESLGIVVHNTKPRTLRPTASFIWGRLGAGTIPSLVFLSVIFPHEIYLLVAVLSMFLSMPKVPRFRFLSCISRKLLDDNAIVRRVEVSNLEHRSRTMTLDTCDS